MMENSYETPRLKLTKLSENDIDLIYPLLNSEGWIKYIGNRNINSVADASAYIEKINANLKVFYWTVSTKADNLKIGIITFIQRDYLNHPDIGFAFLPKAAGNGYALEASAAVYNAVLSDYGTIAAITISGNEKSVKLLEKLGMRFEKEIEEDNEKLLLYTSVRQ